VRTDQVTDEGAAQEIVKLVRKIGELEAEIAQSAQAAPPGSQDLSQGDETIWVRLEYADLDGIGSCRLQFTWNELLSIRGPILIVEATEAELKNSLVEAFRHRITGGGALPYPSIADEDFQRVKLQFRALGLIRELRDKSASGGDTTVWTLTPYGDRLMAQIAAIRSSAKP
jgi:hypothetical protein